MVGGPLTTNVTLRDGSTVSIFTTRGVHDDVHVVWFDRDLVGLTADEAEALVHRATVRAIKQEDNA